jgi:uncharacterized protein (TIGR03435 family)
MKLAIPGLMLFGVIACASPAKRAGDLPPALVWDKLKGNCPPSLDWASLRGQVVVATFRYLFPRIAEWKPLATEFTNQSAIPLLVYSGSEFVLDQELAQNAFSGCVLFDEKNANARAFYGGRFSNETVVVDDRGFIAGWANGNIETAVGSLLKQGASAGLSETAYSGKRREPEQDPTEDIAPSLAVHISAAAANESSELGRAFEIGSGRYVVLNRPLREIIFDLWQVPMARISFPENLPNQNYDVIARMPLDDDALVRKLVQEAVASRFGLRVEKETRAVPAYVLTAGNTLSPHLQLSRAGTTQSSAGGEGRMSGTAAKLEDIASEFEGLVEAPVVDETGLTGAYDYFGSSPYHGADAAVDPSDQLRF